MACDLPEFRGWLAAILGLGLMAGLGAQSYAAAATLQGRWAMAPQGSSFEEAVTGPAPDAATLVVTRDDPHRFAYLLVERRGGVEVARAAYDAAFDGAPSTSQGDGTGLKIRAERDGRGDVVLLAPRIGGSQAAIHVRRTGPDSALLEHEVATEQGVLRLETISLVRADGEGDRP